MDQVTFNVTMDARLKGEIDRECYNTGMNVTDMIDDIVRTYFYGRRGVFPDVSTDAVKSEVVTDEEILQGIEEIEAGFGVRVTMDELRALRNEPPEGPVYWELMRRSEEVGEKLREWRESRGYPDA